MSRTTLRMMAVAVVVAAGLLGQSLVASIVVVGPSTCKPAYKHYSTIQGAVSAVPFNTTIMVCPGAYPEQVVISQPLTVEGVTDGTGSAAVIQVPGGGLVQNANSNYFGPVAAQLLVQNTVGVTIKDLIVDGSGGNCPAGANRTIGIEFFNVGTANDGTGAGKIQNTLVRNETNGCGLGEGILSDTSYITITGNELHDIDRTAIVAFAAKNSITNNSVQRSHNYGILLDFAANSIVSGNSVSDGLYAAILVQDATWYATVSKNTVMNTFQAGIWFLSAYGSTATQNVVSNAPWPFIVWYGYYDTIQNNTFNNASVDGILDEFSYGGNNITKNTVNEAYYGIFTDSSVGGDTLVPNNLFNVVITIDPNPNQGPNPPDQI